MKGYCNRCGECCRIRKSGKTYTCQHLVEIGKSTLCAVHPLRTHLMPIVMRSEDGSEIAERCVPGFPSEGDVLPKGCTYEY